MTKSKLTHYNYGSKGYELPPSPKNEENHFISVRNNRGGYTKIDVPMTKTEALKHAKEFERENKDVRITRKG